MQQAGDLWRRHAPGGGGGADPRRRRPRRGHGHRPAREAPAGSASSPVHPPVTAALRACAGPRDRLGPAPRADRFFVPVTGRARRPGEADQVFGVITALTGIRAGTVRPRIDGRRHSFAVHTLIGRHRPGADISALLPALSACPGHVEPENTDWYLPAVPELMQLAAARPEHGAGQS
jgi:integrase/recombinase XerD